MIHTGRIYQVPTSIIRYIQGSFSGCVLREIPGVTQVEKGHGGNTAAATAYLCWVKHGHRSSRTGVPADYLIFALNICCFFVAFVSEAFSG